MYHSYLVVDKGQNPDRPRPGRKWIENIYSVHQRLCMGFPTNELLLGDPEFLMPFKSNNFAHYNNEQNKNNKPKFLFRIDNIISDNEDRAIIFIQSEHKPDWNYAFRNAGMLIANMPIVEPWEYTPSFKKGDLCRFRISINLSKKSNKYNKEGKERNYSGKEQSKRIALNWNKDEDKDDVIRNWFINKTKNKGFEVGALNIIRVGWKYGWKHIPGSSKPITLKFRDALIEGTLAVNDPAKFEEAFKYGIGSGKAFGYGLLSVKKISEFKQN